MPSVTEEISAQRLADLWQLGLSFLGVFVSTPFVMVMMGAAWETQGLTYHLVWTAVAAVGADIFAVILLNVGLFFGLVVLMWFDRIKRVQAAVLTAFALLGLLSLFATGRWGRLGAIAGNVHWLTVGLLAGVLVGGGARPVRDRVRKGTMGHYEFRGAPKLLASYLTVFVVLGYLERHLVYDVPAPRNELAAPSGLAVAPDPLAAGWELLAAAVLLVTFWSFVGYEDRRSILLVGPPDSGKTSLMVGLYHQATRSRAETLDADGGGPLADLHESFLERGFDALSELGAYVPLRFEYTHGELIARHLTIRSVDYNVDIDLSSLVDAPADDEPPTPPSSRSLPERLRARLADGGELELPDRSRDLDAETIESVLGRQVEDAETLLVVVPLRDFVADLAQVDGSDLPGYFEGGRADTGYLETLATLLEQTGAQQKDVVVVVTMADLVVDTYEAKGEGRVSAVDNYDRRARGTPSFRQYVTSLLTGADPAVQRLARFSDDQYFYPFYFPMAGDDDPTPRLVTDGDVLAEPVGAKQLLERLGR